MKGLANEVEHLLFKLPGLLTGVHSLQSVASAPIPLAAGYHAARVGFFDVGVNAQINVSYAGPDTGGSQQLLAGEFPGTVDASDLLPGHTPALDCY